MLNFSQKLFYKNKTLLAFTLISAIGLVGFTAYCVWLILSNRGTDFMPLLDDMLCYYLFYCSPAVFVAFLLISFEFFYMAKKDELDEAVSSVRGANIKLFCSQLFVLTLLNLFFSLVFLLFVIWCFNYYGSLNVQTVVYGTALVFLNYFLVSLTATFCGKAVSLAKSRSKAYSALLAVIIIAFGGTFVFSALTDWFGIAFGNLPYLFYLFSPELRVTTNYLFMFSVLPYRFTLVFFWIALLCTVVYVKENVASIKKSVVILSILLASFNLIFTLAPQSRFLSEIYNPVDEYGEEERCYYQRIENNRFAVEQVNEPAEFEVTQYDLDFDIFLNFKAKACVTVDKADLSEYKFTLYHTYKLSGVTDQSGNKLAFEQNGDYITVKNNGCAIRQIVMCYKGNSPTSFANVQAVGLYGGFAYYPVAGFHKVYNVDFGYYDVSPNKAVLFNVSVRSPLRIYSNLDEVSKGKFSSVSDCVTLVGGFVDSKTVDGTEYIYPYLDYGNDEYIKQVSEAVENGDLPKKRKIFLTKRIRFMNFYSDYAELNYYTDFEENIRFSKMDRDKYSLYTDSLNDNMSVENGCEFSFDNNTLKQSYNYSAYSECIKKYGVGTVFESVKEYAFDDADTRTPDEFLADLYNNEK